MSDVHEVGDGFTTTNVTVTTTNEIVVASTGLITVPKQTCRVLLIGFFTILTGTDTTAALARIRRGSTVSATQVGETVTLDGTNETNQVVTIMAAEDLSGVGSVEYVLTADQVDAAADGTVGTAHLIALVT